MDFRWVWWVSDRFTGPCSVDDFCVLVCGVVAVG